MLDNVPPQALDSAQVLEWMHGDRRIADLLEAATDAADDKALMAEHREAVAEEILKSSSLHLDERGPIIMLAAAVTRNTPREPITDEALSAAATGDSLVSSTDSRLGRDEHFIDAGLLGIAKVGIYGMDHVRLYTCEPFRFNGRGLNIFQRCYLRPDGQWWGENGYSKESRIEPSYVTGSAVNVPMHERDKQTAHRELQKALGRFYREHRDLFVTVERNRIEREIERESLRRVKATERYRDELKKIDEEIVSLADRLKSLR